jgi:hypothetical protein
MMGVGVSKTGSSSIYLWTPGGASCVQIPLAGFQAMDVAWNSNGASLVVADRDRFCCAYFGAGD